MPRAELNPCQGGGLGAGGGGRAKEGGLRVPAGVGDYGVAFVLFPTTPSPLFPH